MIGWLDLPDGSQVRHSSITRVLVRGELADGTGVFAWQVWANVAAFPEPLALSATPFATESEARAFAVTILSTITPIPVPAVATLRRATGDHVE